METEDKGQVIIYQAENGETSIDVKLENETVWLTQAQMAELFSTDRTSIAKHVITDYTYALDTLDKYDYQQLEVEATTRKDVFRATYESALEAIHLLQQKFGSSDLFGNEKDQSFKSSINTIYQTFDGEELYRKHSV